MTGVEKKELANKIITKALEEGACLAGIAGIDELKKAPAFTLAPKLPQGDSVGHKELRMGLMPGEVAWPEKGKSVLIIALEHPENEPVLDWWEKNKATPGNRILVRTIKRISEWLSIKYDIESYPVVYHVEKGGIFLKDSAVLAGLGSIGRNNLLLTEKYGSKVRLRALILTEDLSSSTSSNFDPCKSCNGLCQSACPQNAFDEKIFSEEEMGQKELPGRDGYFNRDKCTIQMEIDNRNASSDIIGDSLDKVLTVKYCRACEFACPVGRI